MSRGRVITQSELESYATRYTQGETLDSIAAASGVRRQRLRPLLASMGVTIRNRGPGDRWFPPPQLEEMARAYATGQSLEQAANIHGRSASGLRRRLRGKVPIRAGNAEVYRCQINPRCFAEIATEEAAYWLGVLYTDGNVSTKYHTFGISFAERDGEHLARFARFIGAGRGPRVSRGKATMFAKSQTVVADLHRHGVHDRKTWTVTPWQGPAHLMVAFWRGAIDGDGAIMTPLRRNYVQPVVDFCGTEAMVRGLSDFMLPLVGCSGSVSSRLATGREARAIGLRHFSVRWGGFHLAREIVRLLYQGASIALPRKQAIAEAILNLPLAGRRPAPRRV